jgi:hypothetical protein
MSNNDDALKDAVSFIVRSHEIGGIKVPKETQEALEGILKGEIDVDVAVAAVVERLKTR